MKFKKLLFLILVLAILVTISLLKKVQQGREDQKKPVSLALKVLSEELSPSFIEKLSISRGAESSDQILLRKRSSGEWVVENRFNAPAQKSVVETLIKNISDMKGEPRSESKEVLGDYLLQEDQAIKVQVFGAEDKELAAVLLSPLRVSNEFIFVRRMDSDRVLAATPDALSTLEIYKKEAKPDYKIFTDFQIAKIDTSKVSRVEKKESGNSFVLVKKENADKTSSWAFEPEAAGEEIDPSQASNFLSSISNLYAQDVLDPVALETLFKEPLDRVVVEYTQDEKPFRKELIFGAQDKDRKNPLLKVLPEGAIYEVSEPVLKALKKTKSSFLKAKPAKA